LKRSNRPSERFPVNCLNEQATSDRRSGSPYGPSAMCEKCVELDAKIEYYRNLSLKILDQPMLDGIKALIEEKQAQKAALHPEQKP
jgi:hypothetical protein